jgi:cytochrome P450
MGLWADLKVLYHLNLKPIRGASHRDRLDHFYRHQAKDYDAYRRKLLQGREELFETIAFPERGVWIDMGCGTGSALDFIGNELESLAKGYMVDLCPSLLDVARRRVADRSFQKPPRFRRIMNAIFGNGLFANEGSDWLRQRRLMKTAIEQIPIEHHGEQVTATARSLFDAWAQVPNADLESRMIEMALAIRVRTTLGLSSPGDFASIHQCVLAFMEYFADSMQRPLSFPRWVPTRKNRRIRAAVGHWQGRIKKAIASTPRSTAPFDCLLESLLHVCHSSATEEGSSAMSEKQLLDEVSTWILSGTETMANTLTWACYLFTVYEKPRLLVLQELDKIPSDQPITPADVESLKYTQAFLQEVMRLYPQAYVLGRKSLQPFTMDGYHFPKGTTVILNQWAISRDSRWFDQPLEFQPERWIAEPLKTGHRCSYLPYGGGPRVCIGRALSQLELPLVFAELVRRFHLRIQLTAGDRPQPSLTLRPARGMQATMTAKSSTDA